MRLSRRSEPLDSDLFIYELKIDGFRALAHIHNGKGELVSRNGNTPRGFAELAAWIAEHLRVESAVLDGEICCLDESGRPTFRDLIFRKRQVLTVIGEVKDIKQTTYQKIWGAGMIYRPVEAEPQLVYQFVTVRTSSDPRPLIPLLRRAVHEVDPRQAIRFVDIYDDVLEQDLGAPRFRAILLTAFALIALCIATIGVYGVVSHSASTRLHEIGVRMAVGAGRLDIVRMVLGEGVLIIVAGIFFGVLGSLGLTRLIASFLFHTEAIDGVTFAFMALTLAVVAFAACWVPARRAAGADPASILRSE